MHHLITGLYKALFASGIPLSFLQTLTHTEELPDSSAGSFKSSKAALCKGQESLWNGDLSLGHSPFCETASSCYIGTRGELDERHGVCVACLCVHAAAIERSKDSGR